jgi:ubiquinol-cytochrome c reductase cytochrome b subunit
MTPTPETTPEDQEAQASGWVMAVARRLPVFDFLRALARKPVPANLGYEFCLGSVCLFLLVNQLVTGALLCVYYRPTVAEAYESVQYIQEEVRFGWLVRQLHAWGANLMVMALVAHMTRIVWWGSYKSPREVNWLLGMGILGLTLTLGFTGYLLPWDQLSFWASKVGTEIPGAVPGLGPVLVRLMRAGDEISGATLSRFFALHVIALPVAVVCLVGLHLVLMRSHGISSYPDDEGSRRVPFFPNHVVKDMVLIFAVLALLYGLVVVSPWELHDKANPLDTPEGVKPEWYFLWTYQLLKYFPTSVGPFTGKVLGLLASGLIVSVFALLPFLDRGPERAPGRRRKILALTAVLSAGIVTLTALGYVSERTILILGHPVHFDMQGVPRS